MARTDERRGYMRADIQALRTVAVLSVVLFHLWPTRLSGGYVGVDVFFVISGFLITAHMLRDAELGRFSVTRFWAKRIVRLLPASLLVLALTGVAVWFLAPLQYWDQWFREIAASTVYVQNWVLASDAVDYMAAENVASPVQHYWSLSTEEQFYIVWPLLIAGAILLGKAMRTSWQRLAGIALGLVVVASFVASVVWTAGDQAYAYFITPTRAWEFGAGALLVFAPALTRFRTALTWVGLGLILVAVLTFEAATPFPGYWAAIPVVGTALVIWAQAQDRFTVGIAKLRPVQFVGDVSYAIYLWHWPLIVLVPFVTGADLRTLDKLAILAVSVLLAWGTRVWVERPMIERGRLFRPRVSFVTAAVASVLIVLLAMSGGTTAERRIEAQLSAAVNALSTDAECFGAAAQAPGASCDDSELEGTAVPEPAAAAQDTPGPYTGPDKCPITIRGSGTPQPCLVGDRDGSMRVALVGDSHAVQYASTFTRMAEANGWALDIIFKPGCPFSDAMRVQDENLTQGCVTWQDNVEKHLAEQDYDLVATSQMNGVDWPAKDGVDPEQYAVDGLVSLWERITASGTPLVVLADNPKPMETVIECLTEAGAEGAADCATPRAEATGYFDPQAEAAKKFADDKDFAYVDLTNFYCDDQQCLPVIGGATVYRDSNHITNTFASTLAPFVLKDIQPLLNGKR